LIYSKIDRYLKSDISIEQMREVLEDIKKCPYSLLWIRLDEFIDNVYEKIKYAVEIKN